MSAHTTDERSEEGVDAPRLVRPYVEADYINALSQMNNQVLQLEDEMMALQALHAERADELALAIGISTGRESWWGATDAEKHNVLMMRIKRMRPNA